MTKRRVRSRVSTGVSNGAAITLVMTERVAINAAKRLKEEENMLTTIVKSVELGGSLRQLAVEQELEGRMTREYLLVYIGLGRVLLCMTWNSCRKVCVLASVLSYSEARELTTLMTGRSGQKRE